MTGQHTTAELAAGYFKAKGKLSALQAEHEAAEQVLKAQIKLLEEVLLDRLHTEGLSSVRVEQGTFGVSERVVYKAEDMALARQYAAEHDELGIFNMSISVTGVKEYIERNEGNLPPGVTEVRFDQAYNRPTRGHASA